MGTGIFREGNRIRTTLSHPLTTITAGLLLVCLHGVCSMEFAKGILGRRFFFTRPSSWAVHSKLQGRSEGRRPCNRIQLTTTVPGPYGTGITGIIALTFVFLKYRRPNTSIRFTFHWVLIHSLVLSTRNPSKSYGFTGKGFYLLWRQQQIEISRTLQNGRSRVEIGAEFNFH